MSKRLIALLLALVLCMGLVIPAAAATETAETAEPEAKGFRSVAFQQNTHKYEADDVVRAIVTLKTEPAVMSARGGQSETSVYAVQRAQAKVQTAMAEERVEYDLQYTFDTLLNGFSCDVAYGDLDTIADLPEVEAVYIANSYSVPVVTKSEQTQMTSSNETTGVNDLYAAGYMGEGTVVAVLDTGLLTTHEAFQPNDKTDATGKIKEADISKAAVEGKYLSSKVPFAYDYADEDDDVDDQVGHGTHVSGIAAGCTLDEDGEMTFRGVAPYAQILSMKIFSDYGASTTSDVYMRAMEDAYKLGADVINLSIGAQNGFTYDPQLENDVGQTIFERLSAAGVVMSVAGGNEFSMDYYSAMGYTGTEYQDYGSIASPSTYYGSTSVASMENAELFTAALQIGGKWFAYSDSCTDGEHGWLDTFGSEELSYVLIPDTSNQNPLGNGVSLGAEEDFAGLDLEDKIAVVQRGELSFEDKVANAASAGAAGCLIVNNESTNDDGMSISEYTIPAVIVTVEAMDALKTADPKTIQTSAEDRWVFSTEAGEMSDFSNWGTSPDLTIDPVVTSIGGKVYSASFDGDDQYEIYSGTSMATPNFSGTALLTLQYLRAKNPTAETADLTEQALALLESTAVPVKEASGSYYSVRKQGSGLANASKAVYAYKNGGYITNPIQELGDDAQKTGKYTTTLTLANTTGKTEKYRLRTVVQCGDVTDAEDELHSDIQYANTLTTKTLEEGKDYTVAYGSASEDISVSNKTVVSVTITLTDTAKTWLNEHFANGTYVEAYVFADHVSGEDTSDHSIHATILAFYGDWAAAPVAETMDFGDYMQAEYAVYHDGGDIETDPVIAYMPTPCYTRPNIALNATFDNGVPDMPSYYVGGNRRDLYFETEYDSAHNAMSTSAFDGSATSSHGMYVTLSQLRNCIEVTMTIKDATTGQTYYVQTQEYMSKCYYDTYAWYPADMFYWDGVINVGENSGAMVASGTKTIVSFDGVLPWKSTAVKDLWSFPLEVDYTAPVVTGSTYSYDEDTEAATLTVSVKDNSYLASVCLTDEYGSILDCKVVPEPVAGETTEVTFDVSWMVGNYTSVQVVAEDYATNESLSYRAPLFATGDAAAITLISPTGTATTYCQTGDQFTFPTAVAVTGYQFQCWSDHTIEQEEDIWAVYPAYKAGTSVDVVTDATYYAVYAAGETVTYDPARFYAPESYGEDFSGTYALVGLNTDDDGYYLEDDPQVLASDGTTKDAVDEYGVTPPELGDEYNFEFYSSEDSFRYEIAKTDDDTYTIQNTSTDKYLTIGEGQTIVMADEPDEWTMEQGWEGNVVVKSAENEDYGLAYDDSIGAFVIYDENVLVDAGDWGELVPSEWLYLWLYRCVAEEFVADYYTTDVTLPDEPDDPTPPVRPDPPVNPNPPVTTTPVLTPVVSLPFTDVSVTHKAYEAIRYLYENGIMDGVGNNRFAPDSTLTRAMVVTILYRLDGKEAVSFSGKFSDVAAGLWYSEAIEWAASHGIVEGIGHGKFAPTGEITREQLAAILQRYAAYRKLNSTASATLDVSAQVSGWAEANVKWAVAFDLLEGGKTVNAKTTATRAEVALAIYGFIRNLIK